MALLLYSEYSGSLVCVLVAFHTAEVAGWAIIADGQVEQRTCQGAAMQTGPVWAPSWQVKRCRIETRIHTV